MKHIAIIQSEFLKIARKWDDLTLEEQKGYLSRHPKSKRRITARPDGQTSAPSKSTHPDVAKTHAAVNPYFDKLKHAHPRSGFTDHFISKVDDVLYNNAEIPRSDFGLSMGKQWGKQFVDELADAGILKIVKKDRKQYIVNPANTSIEEAAPKEKVKKKFTVDSVNEQLNQLGKRLPSHGYIGGGQTELEKIVGKYAALMQVNSVLRGEKTLVQIPASQNAYYPHIMSSGRIPLSARTAYQGVIRSFKNQALYGDMPEETPKDAPKVPTPKEKTDAVKEIKEKVRKFPAEEVKNGLESLRFRNAGGFGGNPDKDDVMEFTDKKGNIYGYETGFRDLGVWHSRPYEEDDDQANWDPDSYKKYSKEFDDWLSRRSWFDPDTMKSSVSDGEKSWAYFRVEERDLKQEKIKRNHLKLQVQKALAEKNGTSFEKQEKLNRLGNKLSSKWAQHWVERELLKQKRDGTWKVDRKKLNKALNNID